MSGYAGIVANDGETPDSHLLERMAARLAFRGPDATHIWSRPGAGFCFTLLRTGPAPQASQQPCTLDGRVWLLGDVRLDGRDEVIRRLEQAGESFEANVTDEELVLREWRRRGEACLPELLGDFAFAIWDEQERTLLCARDLLGMRPFFYAHAAGRLHFSNTLDALRLVPELSSALDPEFIGDFLLQDFCADPVRTAFADISRLPGGHVLKFSGNSARVRRYVSLPIEEPLWLRRSDEYVERFQSLLAAAVRDRLPQGPAAILMSGGLDSTSVAAIANKIAGDRGTSGSLRAYTIDYTPLFADVEGRYASIAANHIGIPIEIFSGAACMPFDGWDELGPLMAEPCNEPFLLLNRDQYQRVQCHSHVALGGLGGDDILTGQAWPYLVYLFSRLRLLKISTSFGGYFLKHGRFPPLLGGFRTRIRKWIHRPDPMSEYPQWIAPEFETQLGLRDRWVLLNKPRTSPHLIYPLGYAGLTSHYWSSTIEGEDAAVTGAPVELRSPLLDTRILRYLLRVPPVPWCAHKDLLRHAMIGLLPDQVRKRPKTPLLYDSLLLHVEDGTWRPTPPEEPAVGVCEFVDWERLRATLATAPGSNLWNSLRGLSLNYWLERR